jgi:L,D-peptidoglycan transpeptidase YkuD (ErfK/YbiS/YcfS/YnhG family)
MTSERHFLKSNSMKLMYFCICLVIGAAGILAVSAQAPEPSALMQSTQMIVVTTPDWNAVQGTLQRYERSTPHEAWRAAGEPIAIVVGEKGMGWGLGVVATDNPKVRLASDPVKKEGDGRSPAGVFSLGTAFGDTSQPLAGLKTPYLQLTPSVECVDDSTSKYYNRVVDRSTVVPDWNSSEHMLDIGEAYRWGIVVGHNGGDMKSNAHPPVPGGGSCVFLHIWGSATRGTAGCTAMSQDQLETLLAWLDPARSPLLVQVPVLGYARLVRRWGLPPAVTAVRR